MSKKKDKHPSTKLRENALRSNVILQKGLTLNVLVVQKYLLST